MLVGRLGVLCDMRIGNTSLKDDEAAVKSADGSTSDLEELKLDGEDCLPHSCLGWGEKALG